MSKPQPIQIGWPQIKRDYSIVQGNSGIISFSVNALQDNGENYPSYVGFSAKFSLYTIGGELVLSILNDDISIIYTPPSTLTISIQLKSSDTLILPSDSDLYGDVMIISPDSIEKQYPLKINLRVHKSFTR